MTSWLTFLSSALDWSVMLNLCKLGLKTELKLSISKLTYLYSMDEPFCQDFSTIMYLFWLTVRCLMSPEIFWSVQNLIFRFYLQSHQVASSAPQSLNIGPAIQIKAIDSWKIKQETNYCKMYWTCWIKRPLPESCCSVGWLSAPDVEASPTDCSLLYPIFLF